MILAAGRGSRMNELTATTPKPLVPVLGKPLIEYHLEKLERAGFKDVVVNVSWLAQKLQHYFDHIYRGSLNVTVLHEPQALETGGGVYNALEYLSLNNEPFLVINSDVMTDFDYALVKKDIIGLAHLYLIANPLHNRGGDYAIIEPATLSLKGECDGVESFTFSGISVLTPKLFENAQQEKFSLVKVFNQAIAKQLVSGQVLDNQWFDVGTIERLALAQDWQAKIANCL
jgi:MurNAc alpha-1-phosphate uridylyltransferase